MKINAMVFEPGKPGEMREIDDSLEGLQAVVGGYIEQVTFPTGLCAICNEHGKLENLPNNRWGFCGTIFFVSDEGEDYVSLTPAHKLMVEGFIAKNERLVY